MSNGQVKLVVSQGGGGYGDPLERELDLVVADAAEGLVSPEAARQVYGVVMRPEPGYPRPDQRATAIRRAGIRTERLGDGRHVPPLPCTGRRFSVAFAIVPSRLPAAATRWSAAGAALGLWATTENLYDHLTIRTTPTSAHAPLGLHYEGSEEFVIRTCYCPSCGRQVDVLAGRTDKPSSEPSSRSDSVGPEG